MKYSQARQGRVFVVRLEDQDIVTQALEDLARKENIKAATLTILGGMDAGTKLVTGPAEGRAAKIVPLVNPVENVHEAVGAGTIFPDADGNPVAHIHFACGRNGEATMGCAQAGVKVWHVMEAIVSELLDTTASKPVDSVTGFKLLVP